VSRHQKLFVLGIAVAAVAVAGAAIGATKALTPKQESQAVLDDAARQLGVQPNELSNALKQALKNRVEAAVEDGRLTKEEAARIKKRIDANEIPFFGLGPGFHRGPGPGFHREHHSPFHAKLEAATKYLGMSQSDLRKSLDSGKTLAQVARDRDKSVDGLVDALVADAETNLDGAVKAGRLTEAEKKEMLAGLKKRITDLVSGRFPRPPGPGFRHIEPGQHHRPASF
jgi:AraC-like DNA-binding protein/outer membrane murein-binding lipoprotein Lpp